MKILSFCVLRFVFLRLFFFRTCVGVCLGVRVFSECVLCVRETERKKE